MSLITQDFIFIRQTVDENIYRTMKGRKSERSGYYYPWLKFNLFSDSDTPIPEGASTENPLDEEWIKKFMYDANKHRAVRRTLWQHEDDDWYAIHDNGGRSFVVYTNDSRVSVYRIPVDSYIWDEDWKEPFEENLDLYTELVVEVQNPSRVFLGKDKRIRNRGNSVLVETDRENKRYLFIGGDSIYRFQTTERIRTLYSWVGPSDASYPVAVSQNNVYFMIDRVYLPKTSFPVQERNTWMDCYTEYYAMLDIHQRVGTGFSNIETV